ncbi:MAG: hypothetical protein H6573_06260 [Lewinellaceae bacterium]|nr:hypothetical protein [Phaeodactylibacter sp.]MCB0614386.1 hypothetical protein [Phaeodactylibacter sp.]MCB9347106.1 hypothetical protein [Lewinellaceae bacterium]
MNENQEKKLQEILDYGYEFHFGEYISKGFELFQKNAGGFIGFAFVAGLIVMVASLIPFIGSIASGFFLSPALTVGAYLVANKLDKGERTEFADFFKGFDFIGPLAIATAIMTAIILASLIPMFVAWGMTDFFSWLMDAQSDPFGAGEPPSFPAWSILLMIPAVYLGVAYGWAIMFIAFYRMSPWEALEMSRKMITRQWLALFLYTMVLSLLAAFGVVLLFVGIFVTYPIMLCSQYAAFADVTRLMEENESDIVDHLVS